MQSYAILCLFALVTIVHTAATQQYLDNDSPMPSSRQLRVPSVCFNCVCGVSARAVRLVGGQPVQSEEYPWLAAVFVGNATAGGALVSNRYVLTSASNVAGTAASLLTVALGSSALCSLNAPLVNVSVESVHVQPGYMSSGPNLALLRLGTPVVFGPDIRPICLPPSDRSTYWGNIAWVISWGGNATTSNNSSVDNSTSLYTCRPRQLLQPVLRPDLCGVMDGRGRGQGCIGSPGAPSLICQTDAGGLVQVKGRRAREFQLIGILDGDTACNTTDPASFTRTAFYLRWILSTISDSCVCHAPGF